jgi:hypothetical protein
MVRSDVAETLRRLDVTMREGASDEDIRATAEAAGEPLSDDYLSFLRVSNGAEGWIGENYLQLSEARQAAETTSSFSEFVPGLFFFGGDGGEGLFAFDLRTDRGVVITHTDDLELDGLVRAAESFTAFVRFLQENDWNEFWSRERTRMRTDG